MYGGLGNTGANTAVGVISAVIDNIPVMFAVLQMDPAMGLDQWLLITLTAGTGGSLAVDWLCGRSGGHGREKGSVYLRVAPQMGARHSPGLFREHRMLAAHGELAVLRVDRPPWASRGA